MYLVGLLQLLYLYALLLIDLPRRAGLYDVVYDGATHARRLRVGVGTLRRVALLAHLV